VAQAALVGVVMALVIWGQLLNRELRILVEAVVELH
jgi:hypothetical protein